MPCMLLYITVIDSISVKILRKVNKYEYEYEYKTRNNSNLHLPIANLSKFNKGAYISGIQVFNHLPQYIKALTNDQKYFKSKLKRFLYHHFFYSMNEYYEYKEDRRI